MTATVLIVDDEESPHIYAGEFLRKHGYEVISAYTLEEARTHLKHESADIILLDIKLPDGYGPNLLEESLRLPMRPPIILITAWGDIETAVNAMKGGAHDFLQKPIKLDQLLESVKRAEELVSMRRELLHLRKAQTQELDFVVSKSQVMKDLLAQIQRVANTSVSLLLTGESGTGKDILG
jgi:DNA-binding NtrC family response regulator